MGSCGHSDSNALCRCRKHVVICTHGARRAAGRRAARTRSRGSGGKGRSRWRYISPPIRADHPHEWSGDTKWIEGLDPWIENPAEGRSNPAMNCLKPWKRAPYTQFDFGSPAYSDLLFFTSIVRHVFFDTNIGCSPDDEENQLRCYTHSAWILHRVCGLKAQMHWAGRGEPKCRI
jgi:hypothetical protein